MNKKQWIKLIGFVVVSGATWLNPSAGFLIFLLKLCFHILKALQEKPQNHPRQNPEIG
ncbi:MULTISPECIES: hypothetical protein [unclassified Leptolyngbya]|uniref:hypothetical protein n=1 Tax=unclassified Leptolyngbya TaxID=2650499 RepID=UPI0016898BE8|nr:MULTISPECIES: hypothetical protein [unclassified Leptolyngbya]MBD1913641.1 hypothetical protein [Leptolyngbya sp. FACHB-8]MBD2155502.1 hypothetical protein [Leptolyngbya sp. FACHB-16]